MDSRFTFSLVLVLTCLTFVNGTGKCFLKDTCDATRHRNIASKSFVKKIPCVEIHAPTQLSSDDFELYKKLCPNLAKDGNFACCDRGQLENLQHEAEFLSSFGGFGDVLARSCYENYMELFCKITCSPNQSNFFDVEKESQANPMFASWNKFKVDKATVAIELKDVSKFFRSCLSKFSLKENKTFLQAFRNELGEIPNKATTLFYQMQSKAHSFELDFHFLHDFTEFHVVRDPLTGEYSEEPILFPDSPIKLDLKD